MQCIKINSSKCKSNNKPSPKLLSIWIEMGYRPSPNGRFMIGFTMFETYGYLWLWGSPSSRNPHIYFTTNTCNTCYLYQNLNLSSLLKLDEFVVIVSGTALVGMRMHLPCSTVKCLGFRMAFHMGNQPISGEKQL